MTWQHTLLMPVHCVCCGGNCKYWEPNENATSSQELTHMCSCSLFEPYQMGLQHSMRSRQAQCFWYFWTLSGSVWNRWEKWCVFRVYRLGCTAKSTVGTFPAYHHPQHHTADPEDTTNHKHSQQHSACAHKTSQKTHPQTPSWHRTPAQPRCAANVLSPTPANAASGTGSNKSPPYTHALSRSSTCLYAD